MSALLEATAPRLASRFVAELAWLDHEPSRPGDRFWLRHGTRNVLARIKGLERLLDRDGGRWREPVLGEATLAPNAIARVEIETQQPLAIDADGAGPAGATFVLVDSTSERTVATGTIRAEPGPVGD